MCGGAHVPMPYQPTGQGAADQNFQQIAGQMSGAAGQLAGSVVPQYQNIVNATLNNPYASGAQDTANQAAVMGQQQIAPRDFAGAQGLQGMGNQAVGAGSQILANGFDPQHALYNQGQQQNMDQMNAINAMNGVAGSPFGAGLAQQGNQNFNLDWGDRQLGRQNMAAQGFGALEGAANGAFQGAGALNQAGLATFTGAGMLPSATFLQNQQSYMDALNGLVNGTNAAYGLDQQVLGDQANYMNIGQNATTIAQHGQGQQFGQDMAIGQGLGKMFGDIFSMMGGGFG